MGRSIDLTNKKINYLTVLCKANKKDRAGGNYWLCQCDCGIIKEISTNAIVRESTVSCGCYRKNNNTKHGKSDTRLHNIWMGLRNRCNNPKGQDYHYYGGRGIKICEEWSEFLNFYNWANNNGYEDTLTIDRKDPNGNYSPENCRWSTMEEQANNRNSNINLTYKGITKNIAQWAKELKTSRHNIMFNFDEIVKLWENK